MTYDQAHNILHDKPPDDSAAPPPPPLTAGAPVDRSRISSLKTDLKILTKLARKLRKDREEIGGAVDLSSGDQGNELKFTLDENNNPTRVTPKKQLEIHHTIAELMILANTWVAKTIHERMPDRALLRVHRSAEDSRFEDLKEVLSAGKISLDGSSNMALAKSLKEAEKVTKSGFLMSLFQSLATRAMSEAQYVCTGQAEGDDGLSHFGLGLEKYTHFTSPIRRYADVVVHKQLLFRSVISSESEKKPLSFQRQVLHSLPDSKVISILSGEGLTGEAVGEEPLEAEKTYDGKILTTESASANRVSETANEDLYEPKDVSRICARLNHQNRMAKLSSFECQRLFLSLYFKDHTETTQAVVINLRANGFWVYVPRFDMRGPVYLSDVNGNLQIDPALVKLPQSAGEEASLGFASSGCARMFSAGNCTLVEGSDEFLEVKVPESGTPYKVQKLDVVTVKILCDNWDASSRVPLPRLHLIADESKKNAAPKHQVTEPTKTTIPAPSGSSNVNRTLKTQCDQEQGSPTIYEELLKLHVPPNLPNESIRGQLERKLAEPRGERIFPGRVIFGDFRNPDTISAQQEASIAEASAAATQRRNQIMAAQQRNKEFEMSRQIEKDATARMQRLAAVKRNARKGKGK